MPSLKSDLSFWLKKHNIQPNKDLGQCFLISDSALNKIIATADIKRGEKVLEIGSGTGILTEKLIAKGASVLGVEKDSRLAWILHERFEKELRIEKLKLIQADFLDMPFPETLESLGWKSGEYKVVANLPYQITSPAIERLLERDFLPSKIVMTIQKEVAERICAQPGNLSSLAVLVQACAQEYALAAKFPSSYFFPAPGVESALLKLDGISYDKFTLTTSKIDPSTPPPEAESLRMTNGKVGIKGLRQVIRIGFAQKRKKLKKNLQNVFDKEIIEKIWRELGIDDNTRAQELEVGKWIEITKTISK